MGQQEEPSFWYVGPASVKGEGALQLQHVTTRKQRKALPQRRLALPEWALLPPVYGPHLPAAARKTLPARGVTPTGACQLAAALWQLFS